MWERDREIINDGVIVTRNVYFWHFYDLWSIFIGKNINRQKDDDQTRVASCLSWGVKEIRNKERRKRKRRSDVPECFYFSWKIDRL